jgi:hypothetical protein
MLTFRPNTTDVNRIPVVKGRGLNRRKLSAEDRVALVLDYWTGAARIEQPSLRQAIALVSGVSRSEIYKLMRARANRNNGGDHAENGNGADANPPSPATLAADLVETVGFDTALDLLVRINGDHGDGGGR